MYIYIAFFEWRHVIVFGSKFTVIWLHYGVKFSKSPLIPCVQNIRFSLEIAKLCHFPLCDSKLNILMSGNFLFFCKLLSTLCLYAVALNYGLANTFFSTNQIQVN